MRVNATVIIDKHDRPIATLLLDEDGCDPHDEPWMSVEVGEGVALIGPADQIGRWVQDLYAAVSLA